MTTMVQFQEQRRHELAQWPETAGTGVQTKGAGSRANTEHLNLVSSIAILPRDKGQGRYIRSKAPPKPQPKAMAEIHAKKLRRAMQARELALMGFSVAQAARTLRISEKGAYNYAREYGFSFALPPESDFRKAVRAAYAEGGGGPAAVVAATGASYENVKSAASKMGLTNSKDRWRFNRGFAIPDDRMAEYRELRSHHLPISEVAEIMGLNKPTVA